jgi:FAD:protein FMN transferase
MAFANKKVTRRQVLRIVAGAGVAGLALKVGLSRGPVALSETRLLIGTIVKLTVLTYDTQAGQHALNACLGEMSSLESALSRFIPGSEVSQLNRDGHIDSASPCLLSVLRQAQQIHDLSHGAFDVTILPVLALYQDYASTGRGLPPEGEVQRVRAHVGAQNLTVEGGHVALADPEMKITLDGIAKGFVIDSAAAVLRGHGFGDILVKAGGDLMAMGQNAYRVPWEVGIQSPRQEQGIVMARFGIENRAVATSGDYMQPFASDYSEHHILDPRTGHSAHELSSATVIAPTAILADALATAVMVMGAERGMELIRGLPGCETFLVTKDQTIRTSTMTNSL